MSKKGFTLVELLVVIVIIGILAAAAISVFGGGTDKAKMNTMKSDVSAMHSAGTLALADKGWSEGRLPGTLAKEGYLSEVPKNPFNGSVSTYGYGYAQSQVVTSVGGGAAGAVTNPIIFAAGWDSVFNKYDKGGSSGINMDSVGLVTGAGATNSTFWTTTVPVS